LTLLEAAFRTIGFSEYGAILLCCLEGENVKLEAYSCIGENAMSNHEEDKWASK
jgi:hypothetical protein